MFKRYELISNFIHPFFLSAQNVLYQEEIMKLKIVPQHVLFKIKMIMNVMTNVMKENTFN